MTSLCILGSTGSIGTQTLAVARNLPDVQVVGLAARSGWRQLLEQAKETGASVVGLEDAESAATAEREKASFGLADLTVLSGKTAASTLAALPDADIVVHAIPGFRGIKPLVASLEAGKRVAFAGKEALVCAGDLLSHHLRAEGKVIPVDSEHSAIFQCLLGEPREDVTEIVLTASGGALRDFTLEQMASVTPPIVLNHPTWKMGPKVTVDSATLFNKALEVMEAHHLFGMPMSKIRVAVHRQSIVHSMVTFRDGSTKAQMSRPDMRVAIAYAISYPRRVPVAPSLFPYVGALTFEEPDLDRFPCLGLGFRAQEMGGTAPCALSVADEELVDLFLTGRIRFLDIQETLAGVLDRCRPREVDSVEVLEETRLWATATVRELLS
ncbi:MAG: 1-deoxy-D-xylulose-5-phosphate reductoisomerase [Bacillota bacterium]